MALELEGDARGFDFAVPPALEDSPTVAATSAVVALRDIGDRVLCERDAANERVERCRMRAPDFSWKRSVHGPRSVSDRLLAEDRRGAQG